ncbi:putative signal peptide protein, partial [Puccinia sorghi]
ILMRYLSLLLTSSNSVHLAVLKASALTGPSYFSNCLPYSFFLVHFSMLPSSQTSADYEQCIRYLEEVVNLLLTRSRPAWRCHSALRGTQKTPTHVEAAGISFCYSIHRGLEPLVSAEVSESLATSWHQHQRSSCSPPINHLQCSSPPPLACTPSPSTVNPANTASVPASSNSITSPTNSTAASSVAFTCASNVGSTEASSSPTASSPAASQSPADKSSASPVIPCPLLSLCTADLNVPVTRPLSNESVPLFTSDIVFNHPAKTRPVSPPIPASSQCAATNPDQTKALPPSTTAAPCVDTEANPSPSGFASSSDTPTASTASAPPLATQVAVLFCLLATSFTADLDVIVPKTAANKSAAVSVYDGLNQPAKSNPSHSAASQLLIKNDSQIEHSNGHLINLCLAKLDVFVTSATPNDYAALVASRNVLNHPNDPAPASNSMHTTEVKEMLSLSHPLPHPSSIFTQPSKTLTFPSMHTKPPHLCSIEDQATNSTFSPPQGLETDSFRETHIGSITIFDDSDTFIGIRRGRRKRKLKTPHLLQLLPFSTSSFTLHFLLFPLIPYPYLLNFNSQSPLYSRIGGKTVSLLFTDSHKHVTRLNNPSLALYLVSSFPLPRQQRSFSPTAIESTLCLFRRTVKDSNGVLTRSFRYFSVSLSYSCFSLVCSCFTEIYHLVFA